MSRPREVQGDHLFFFVVMHRDVEWTPEPTGHDAGIAAWRPAWVMPCAREVELDNIHVPADAGGSSKGCGSRLWRAYDAFTVLTGPTKDLSTPAVRPARRPRKHLRSGLGSGMAVRSGCRTARPQAM